MATTEVTTWAVDLATLGPIYPFVGSEKLLVLVGLAFWIGFHVWQMRVENRAYTDDMSKLRTPADIEMALEGHRLHAPAAQARPVSPAASPIERRQAGAA
jgi:hypothetical protein